MINTFRVPLLLLISLIFTLLSGAAVAQPYSLVINNGRVIDPESGLDAIRHICIQNDKIIELSTSALQGAKEIDASGLIVSPGFIDLHTHSPTPLGQYYQLFDGVTTALELEVGAFPIKDYGSQIAKQPLINYGASAGYLSMRILEKQGLELPHILTSKPMPVNLTGLYTILKLIFMEQSKALHNILQENATAEELASLRQNLITGLNNGGIGIGLALDYFSEAANDEELAMIFQVAAEHNAPLFIHLRRGINGDPTGLHEALALAKSHGTSLHICHVTHNAMRNTRLFLDEIKKAREQGVDVTTEILPYNAGSALISAAVFNRDWRTIFGIDYGDVEWAETGERFTEETWLKARKENPESGVIHHYLKEETTQMALQEAGMIVVSDLLPMTDKDKKVAPHNGSFSKILGLYVRDERLLDLSTALSKMTILPAKRLERYAPLFKNKGRIQVGADADITIFDAEAITSKATYKNPYQEAIGFHHVIVNGVQVIRDSKLVENQYPGKRLLAR